jgi:hypothetical protein
MPRETSEASDDERYEEWLATDATVDLEEEAGGVESLQPRPAACSAETASFFP